MLKCHAKEIVDGSVYLHVIFNTSQIYPTSSVAFIQ